MLILIVDVDTPPAKPPVAIVMNAQGQVFDLKTGAFSVSPAAYRTPATPFGVPELAHTFVVAVPSVPAPKVRGDLVVSLHDADTNAAVGAPIVIDPPAAVAPGVPVARVTVSTVVTQG